MGRGSGGAVLHRLSNCFFWNLDIISTSPLLCTCFATVCGDFWKNFLRISSEGGHGSCGRLASCCWKDGIISTSPLYLAPDASEKRHSDKFRACSQ